MTDILPSYRTLPIVGDCFLDASKPESLVAADLRNGFAIRDAELPLTPKGVHHTHAAIARGVLGQTGLVVNPVHVGEGLTEPTDMPADSGEHMDCLVGAYYQVHTTYSSDARYSRLVLRGFLLSEQEHAYLQDLQRIGLGQNTRRSISSTYGTKTMLDQLYLARFASARKPDVVIEHEAKTPYETLVFPNGYDAREGSEPGTLWLHRVQSTDGNGLVLPHANRRVWFSRINAAVDTERLNTGVTPEQTEKPRRRLRLPSWILADG